MYIIKKGEYPMKDKEAKAKLAEMSLVLRKNAMLKVGATKDNLRKPAVDSLEKHEPNPSTKQIGRASCRERV